MNNAELFDPIRNDDDAAKALRRPAVLSRDISRCLGWRWQLVSLMLAALLSGCGGGDSSAGLPLQPLPTLSEDTVPDGQRIDLGAFARRPIHARDQWTFDRSIDGVVEGSVRLAVTSGPGDDGSVTIGETDSTHASLNRTLAYRQMDDGLVRLDPFAAKDRYPGLFEALPELLEYPALGYPVGTLRRHLRQGSLRADIDGDGRADYYRAEFTQVFKGLKQLTVFGQTTQVAHFVNTLTLTLKTTRDNQSVTRASTEETYLATDLGFVRADRVTADSSGTAAVPAYRIELREAVVDSRVFPLGQVWKRRESGTPRTLLGIASSGSQAVAVGALGTIISSTDGRSWTARASGITVHLNAVVANGEFFVAVGDLGTIVTSTDLATWTSGASGISRNLRGVAWTGSQFVAVGDGGTILTSPDGKAWIARNAGTSANLYAVAGHSQQIVAVGASSTLITSATGEVWTAQSSRCCDTLRGVVWSGSQFLAVGTGWAGYPASWQISEDGVTWLPQGNCCIGLRAATWSGAHFVAVGESGYTISTADGRAGSNATVMPTVELFGATWHAGEFLAVGADGALLAAAPRAADVSSLFAIAASKTAVVAVGVQGTVLSSSDGTRWVPRKSGVTTALNSVATSDSSFVAVGDKGTLLTSSDLATWVARSSGTLNRLRSVVWTGNQFVAVGDAGTILLSADGVTWTSRQSPTPAHLWSVAGNAGQIVVVGDSGTVLNSTNGDSWVQSTSPGAWFSGVLWSGTQFLAFAAQGTAFTSYDGLQWTERRTVSGNPMYGGGASEAGFVLVGQYGITQTSSEGIAWKMAGSIWGQDLYAAAWFGGRFILVGQGQIRSLP